MHLRRNARMTQHATKAICNDSNSLEGLTVARRTTVSLLMI